MNKLLLILVLGAIGIGVYLYLHPDNAGEWLQATLSSFCFAHQDQGCSAV